MRQIKFRLWRDDSNWGMLPHEDLRYDSILNEELNKDYHIMQFTGLKDRNGKEIYEGDILKITRINWYCPGHSKHNTDLVDQVEVYWDGEENGMFTRTFDFERLKINPNQRPYSSFGVLGNGWNDERADNNIWEVIGNIYENPEFLNALAVDSVQEKKSE